MRKMDQNTLGIDDARLRFALALGLGLAFGLGLGFDFKCGFKVGS